MSEVSRVQEPDPYAHLPLAERIAARAADVADLAAHVAGPGAQPTPAPDYATAYSSLHEVVRAFLAGERNTRYLRRLHAEIEADLTQPASTSEWACERCGSPRWAGWRNGPEHEGWPRKAQCVPCGHVQELPLSEVSRG